MDDFDRKLNNILNDPKMMEQIMAMANALNPPSANAPPTDAPPPAPPPFPEIDMATLQRLSGLAQGGNIDKRERALLEALGAYLGQERIKKLERAMRAAKMAKVASQAISGRAVPAPAGR